ncbi:MAG: hypothetical protein H6Q31_2450 [Bacteroidetes bacterium]|nr:hypothetical protein [Bacteroidota bacterium]
MVSSRGTLPVSIMVWSIHDEVIESATVRESQFADLMAAGFDGVAAFVRCSRYTWDDPAARTALAHISRMCRAAGKHLWVGPDPRFISRALIGPGGGTDLVLFGNTSRASEVPHFGAVTGGRYAVRCLLSPRHVHMLHEVAIEYLPLGVLRAYAVRMGRSPLGVDDIQDITSRTHMFYNARDRYVEAFGEFRPPDDSSWQALAFFHVRSSHVDYSNRMQMREYERRLATLKKQGIHARGLMWDEPGYTCTYGSLPFTPAIRAACADALGFPLDRVLWKLALDAADGSHIPVRQVYYRLVQQTVVDAQRSTNRVMRRMWGDDCIAGIHDTWHFESGDMCDMNHGSMDLWKGAEAKSGGFVDVGAVNEIRDPSSPHYARVAALSVINASLGRHSQAKFAYNNLWTVGDDDGEGWQETVMDHCVNVLALFGTRWLAHAYGPVGTIGEERSFLGSPPLPGYPEHSTWPAFPRWNARLRNHWATTGGRLPDTNVLVVYPVDTLYGLADPRADRVAADVFTLLLTLVDAHYQPDVLSPTVAARGRWKGEKFMIGRHAYDTIILPYLPAPRKELSALLRRHEGQVLHVDSSPLAADAFLESLDKRGVPRPVRGPAHTWVSATQAEGATIVAVVPSRNGGHVEGTVEYGGATITLPRTGGLVTVRFRYGETPEILQKGDPPK